jgi:long-chain acyl-CoA synthetase
MKVPGLRRVVAAKVREKLVAAFGGNFRVIIVGGAALAPEVEDFLMEAGFRLTTGYGMTECGPLISYSGWAVHRRGTVGRVIDALEVRIDSKDPHREPGEVLVRGPNVMSGYYKNPEATREAIDAEGWLHTGDVGQIDADGFLTLTDRKKDLIKTSGGKYVAPAELESRIKMACPLVSQVLVHGDRRSYVTALVTLDPEAVRTWAAGNGLDERDPAALARLPELSAVVQRGLDKVNAALPRYATVKKFRILPAEFTEAAGEVTPSQKLKRRVIEERQRGVLDSMYGPA